MKNVKEKLSNARTTCVGMSNEIYALTDYMSSVANDSLVPMGMALCLGLVMDDLEKGRNGFASASSEKLPDYMIEHKNQIKAQLVYFPQVIDAIAEPDFAEEFRTVCKEFFNFDPPRRVSAEVDESYPAYIKAAVDWWANAVASPKLDNGADMNPILLMMAGNCQKSNTADEIKIFKNTLAEEIMKEMEKYGRCTLDVDYHPCRALSVAGDKIGLNPMMGYPWKTYMRISKNEVGVSAGYRAEYEIIWTNEVAE